MTACLPQAGMSPHKGLIMYCGVARGAPFPVKCLTRSIGFDKVYVSQKKISELEALENSAGLFEKKRRKILEKAKWSA
jgi:hypothetical protein